MRLQDPPALLGCSKRAHRRWQRFRSSGCVLLLSMLTGCGTATEPADGDKPRIRHMSSYSFLDKLDDAELRSEPGVAITPRLVKAGGVERPALFTPAPSTVRFQAISIPPEARLTFSVGLMDGELKKSAAGVRFAVSIEGDAATEIWARAVEPRVRPEDRRWIDVELGLEDFAGRRVDLVLTTEGSNGESSAWGLPILRSAGVSIDLESLPIRQWQVLEDLRPTGPPQILEIEPPAGVALELAGQIVPKLTSPGAPTATVTFTARIDGRPLLAQTLSTSTRIKSFDQLIPFGDLAGSKVELSLEIEDHSGKDPSPATARWSKARFVHPDVVPRRHTSDGRNLLLVVIDTLRADHMSLYGYPRNTTPNLDRLAADSLVFTNAISQSSWTMPATASLLTGLYPPEHGVTDGQSLSPAFDTLAERLQAQGFTTFGLSANPIVGKNEGFDQGFERFLNLPRLRAGHLNEIFRGFLEEHRDLQWFAYLHYMDPHDPYDAPAPARGTFTEEPRSPSAQKVWFKEKVNAINFGRGEADLSDRDIADLHDAYDEEILYWDLEFGRLVDHMREIGLLDKTLIIVTSDHGEEFYDHGRLKHGMQLYDESVRVPLLFSAPGLLNPGLRERPVETRGVADAALSLLARQASAGPVDDLFGEPSSRRAPAFSHTNHGLLPGQNRRTTLVSVQDDAWKYITSIDQEWSELYDLRLDPGETINSTQQQPEVSARYRGLLERWLAESRSARADRDGVDSESTADPETEEKLRALGYIQ